MKKIKNILISLIALVGLSSCDFLTFYLPKPEDTNLELWITEEVEDEKLNNLTFIPGMFGGSIYLGSKYSLREDSYLNPMPEIYVVYTITNYPDTTSTTKAVTRIEITDPEITFYGITLDSSNEEIENAMTKEKFKVSYDERGYLSASKKSVNFSFYHTSIRIEATVTNTTNAQF